MTEMVKTVLVDLLRAYKWVVSPMLPPACRYVPTCSEYAMEAVERHGVFYGSAMALWRLLRCNPFAKGGFDPVPIERSFAQADNETGCSHMITINKSHG
jgi:uncharacterized protein